MQRHSGRGRTALTKLDASARDAEPADLYDIAHADNQQHNPELESLDDVGASELKHVLLFEFFEHAALDLDKLIGHQQSQERVGVRVDGYVEGYDLVE